MVAFLYRVGVFVDPCVPLFRVTGFGNEAE